MKPEWRYAYDRAWLLVSEINADKRHIQRTRDDDIGPYYWFAPITFGISLFMLASNGGLPEAVHRKSWELQDIADKYPDMLDEYPVLKDRITEALK